MEKVTLAKLKKPKNADKIVGQPMLFATPRVAKLKNGGEARLSFNIMTQDWFVTGQKDRTTPYVFDTLTMSIKMMKTIDIFNETGKIEPAKKGDINELEYVD